MKVEGIAVAIVVAMTIGCATAPPPPPPTELIYWQRIHQLCGNVYLEAATKKIIRTQEGKIEERLYETPLRNAMVILYTAEDVTVACCTKAQQVAEAVSDRYGRFEFHGNPAGHYWLVVHMKDREVHVPVVADAYDKKDCEARYLWRIVRVDAMPYPKVELSIE